MYRLPTKIKKIYKSIEKSEKKWLTTFNASVNYPYLSLETEPLISGV